MASAKQIQYETEQFVPQQQQQVFYPPPGPYGVQVPAGYALQTLPPGAPQVVIAQYPQQAPATIIRQVQYEHGHAAPHRTADCCTACWAVTLLVFAILGFGSTVWSLSHLRTADYLLTLPSPTDPNYATAVYVQNLINTFTTISSLATAASVIEFICICFVTYAVFSGSIKPVVRCLNYVAWVFIALFQAITVFFCATIAIIVTAAAAAFVLFFQTVINNNPNTSQNAQTALNVLPTVFAVIFWIATAIALIPMIVSSVVAHRNRSRCTCSSSDMAEERL